MQMSRRALLGAAAIGGAAAAVSTRSVAASAPAPVPRDWTDPATGHRIVRLSDDAGGNKLYFYRNSFTPQGDLMVMSTPAGIVAVDMKTHALTPLVRDPRADLLFTGRRTRTVYYSVSDPGDGAPTDRPRDIFALDIDSRRSRRIARLMQGQVGSINADETLLVGTVAYGDTPLQPDVPDPRNRRFGQAEYAANGQIGRAHV